VLHAAHLKRPTQIVGYQSTEYLRGQFDANWLHIEGVVAHPGGK
jgi:hypothetical protein